jgi:hypothetical protein
LQTNKVIKKVGSSVSQNQPYTKETCDCKSLQSVLSRHCYLSNRIILCGKKRYLVYNVLLLIELVVLQDREGKGRREKQKQGLTTAS